MMLWPNSPTRLPYRRFQTLRALIVGKLVQSDLHKDPEVLKQEEDTEIEKFDFDRKKYFSLISISF